MTDFGVRPRRFAVLLSALVLAGCGDDSSGPTTRGFLEGTGSNPQIGLVVNSTGKALTLFQLGDPTVTRTVPFGASSAVTPTGFVFRGTHAVVPLGNAASAALVDLDGPFPRAMPRASPSSTTTRSSSPTSSTITWAR